MSDEEYSGLALQRRISGDRTRWRTVVRLLAGQVERAKHRLALLDACTEPADWRIVTDDRLQQPVYTFSRLTGWSA